MIGNDIVDITQAQLESNWKRKGFLQKVFTKSEQGLITKSNNPFTMVWRLWSMKESAYKLYIQQGNDRFFNPKRISCEIISSESGKVMIGDIVMNTKTKTTSNYIYSTAFLSDKTEVESHVFLLPANDIQQPSKFTYDKFFDHFSADKNTLTIKKASNGVPQLYCNEQKQKVSFSLTHHGKYGAFSILN